MVPEYIVLHHSLTRDGATVSWDAIRRYHIFTCGWRAIGYHFGIELVRDHHEIFVGRMLNETGAHCKGMNGRSLGICFLGNFDRDPLPSGKWHIGLKLVKCLCEVFKIPRENVVAHRDYAPYKSCPGKLFDMDRFREEL